MEIFMDTNTNFDLFKLLKSFNYENSFEKLAALFYLFSNLEI